MLSSLVMVAVLIAQAPRPSDQTQAPPPPPAQAPATATAPKGTSPWTDDKPFVHVFQNFKKDFDALKNPDVADLLVFAVGGALVVHPKDQPIAAWVQRQPIVSWTGVGNGLGNGFTQAGGAIATWIGGMTMHDDELTHIGGDLIRAQILNGVLTTGTKYVVERTRPNGSPRSFPSGHTSATFATASVLEAHFGWKAGVAGYAVGAFVGWSRIRSNEHWLSDTVAGAMIGAASGRAVTHGHSSKWVMAPVKTTGGAALFVSRR